MHELQIRTRDEGLDAARGRRPAAAPGKSPGISLRHVAPESIRSIPGLSLASVIGCAGSLLIAPVGRSQDAPASQATDAGIAAALTRISPARIQADIEKLVSFGTRSTISAQDHAAIAAGRGIGAAREWIKSEFERYSRECGGCLTVQTDGFMQPPAERVPQPTQITNVYAVLKGSDPAAAQRIVLVTGHYDSRNSDVLDIAGDAPGANDDGSGAAVSLECARVLSKLKFPATIIFLTVAGEEQGLYGSAHFAHLAREMQWNIEAVLNNDIVGGNKDADQDSGTVRVFPRVYRRRPMTRSCGRFAPSAAKAIQARGSWRVTSRKPALPMTPASSRCWCSAWTATCAVAITIPSIRRDSQRCALPNTGKTSITSTRMCAPRMVSSSVIARSSWTSST